MRGPSAEVTMTDKGAETVTTGELTAMVLEYIKSQGPSGVSVRAVEKNVSGDTNKKREALASLHASSHIETSVLAATPDTASRGVRLTALKRTSSTGVLSALPLIRAAHPKQRAAVGRSISAPWGSA
jgi:hypothetical protein